jgi:universal stress protein A
MQPFKKILCPYDFSEHADEALNYAAKLADDYTLLTILNVVELPYLIDPNGFVYYDINREEIKEKSEAEIWKRVNELEKKYPNLHAKFELIVDNNPIDVILTTQQREQYELIVMGSHGRKGLGRLLMGSVAESVLREATCPVLIIKKG